MQPTIQRQPPYRQSRRSHSNSRRQTHRDYAQTLQPTLRNPWTDHHLSSSSGEIPSGPPPPVATWLRAPSSSSSFPAYSHVVYPANPTPVGSSTAGSSGLPDACGPRASACDSFCYHCLQVLYIAGILTGVSLVIAGSVLKGGQRRSDLSVLFYIGILLAAVCTLLLTVHIVVRRGVRKRKKNLRQARCRQRPLSSGNHQVELPLTDFGATQAPGRSYVPLGHRPR